MRKLSLVVFSAIGFGLVATAQAEQRYVSDALSTYVQAGPGAGYRIVGSLNAGDPVQVLSSNNGYSQVKDGKGRTVWLPTNQLSSQPSLKTRLPALEAETKDLREKLANIDNTWNTRTSDMQNQVANSSKKITDLREENEKLKNELIKAGKKLEIADMNLDDRRRELILQWFMYGGGVAGMGLLLGLILPHIIPRRKKRDNRWMN